jgi:hypothetical protein
VTTGSPDRGDIRPALKQPFDGAQPRRRPGRMPPDKWHAQPTITRCRGVPFVEMADIDIMARLSGPYVNICGAEGIGYAHPHPTAVAVG